METELQQQTIHLNSTPYNVYSHNIYELINTWPNNAEVGTE